MKTLVDEVNVGSQEQAKGTEHIAKAIAQMEQVTQSTAASAEESASAAEELSAHSETLKGIAQRLSVIVRGAETTEVVQLESVRKRRESASGLAALHQAEFKGF